MSAKILPFTERRTTRRRPRGGKADPSLQQRDPIDDLGLEARGVYWAHALTLHGDRILYALRSDGRELARVPVPDPARSGAIIEALWALVDAVDPLAALHLT